MFLRAGLRYCEPMNLTDRTQSLPAVHSGQTLLLVAPHSFLCQTLPPWIARLALNGLNSSESSYIARQHLEWPMRFSENQALFTNLAYKGGSLPGILTTVYYAYPIGETSPIVVALFYHDLPGSSTYRKWRSSLAHDEFARWLLYEPEAIPALRELLTPAN